MYSAKVSVIVPSYNMGDKIGKCLQSLINQTLKEIEIIVVNDASTDDTEAELLKYASIDPRIKIISHLENRRRGGARNTGVQNANGEYIGWVDADDWVDRLMYENLYNAAKKIDSDIAQCNYFNVYSNGRASLISPINETLTLNGREIVNSLYTSQKGLFAGLCNKIYKRDLFSKNNIEFIDAYHEDGPINLQLAYYACKLIHVPEALYYYYHYGMNSSLEVDKKSIDDMFESTNAAYDFFKSKDFSNKETQEFIKNFYYRRIIISKLNDIFRSPINYQYIRYLACKISQSNFKKIIKNVGFVRTMLYISILENYPTVLIKFILKYLNYKNLLIAKIKNA